MKLEDFDKILKAFRKRLLKNGTWKDGKISFRYDDPDWGWISFTAEVSLHESRTPTLIRAEWNPYTHRLCNWAGSYANEPWKRFKVL